jgi:hypothetical protein
MISGSERRFFQVREGKFTGNPGRFARREGFRAGHRWRNASCKEPLRLAIVEGTIFLLPRSHLIHKTSERVPLESKPHYHPADGMIRALIVCLLLQMAIGAYVAWTKPPQVYLIPRSSAEMTDLTGRWDQHHARLVAWCEMIAGMTAASLFFPYLVRANRNARAMGADDIPATPIWMIWCFLIPVLNLWKPWKALQEVWQASVPKAGDWKQSPHWWFITVWCVHRVFDNCLGQWVWLWRRWYPAEPTLWPINVDVARMIAATQLLHIIQYALTIVLVWGFLCRQRERFALFGHIANSHVGPAVTDVAEELEPTQMAASEVVSSVSL